jgi:hypothetical protein
MIKRGYRLEINPNTKCDAVTVYEEVKQQLIEQYEVTNSQIYTACPEHVGNGFLANRIEIFIFLGELF